MTELKDTPEIFGQAGVIKINTANPPAGANNPNSAVPPAGPTAEPMPASGPTAANENSKNSRAPGAPGVAPEIGSAVTDIKVPDIYAMPKEFQHHNRVAGGNSPVAGALVIIGSLLFLIIIGGGFFMYIFNPGLLSSLTGQFIGATVAPPAQNLEVAVPATTTPVAATTTPETAMPAEAPQTVYFNFLRELAGVNTFEDYYILVSKYGNGRKISAVESERLLAETTPESDQTSVKALKEKYPGITNPSETSAIKEDISGQTALLTIALPDSRATGTIELTLENNVWKVGNENWSLASVPAAAVEYLAGEDRDGDGLTDQEENLLGSNKDNTDSDSDGYGDLSETLNLYNPASTNKLVDNTSIKSYLAEDKSFYLLYPSKWIRTFNSKDQSVVFRSPDDHFVQLMIETNDRNSSLDDYVKNLLNLTQIKDSWRRTGDAWEGILTEDGLQIYIMGSKRDKIYILRYSPSDNNVLEYPNIFQAMIKSFVIKK